MAAPALLAAPALAQEPPPPRFESRNLYGMTGLIDTPTARMQPDAELGFTVGVFDRFNRNTLTFQALPRVEAAFRYSILDNFFGEGDLFDRSFDVKVLVSEETRSLPAVAIGLQDFLGTGVYSSEYVAATKSFRSADLGELAVTAGVGWGRFADSGAGRNPFCEISNRFCDRGSDNEAGTVDFGRYFSGEDIGFFGGVEWRPPILEGLSLKAEYSPDEYLAESENTRFEQEIPFNFGVDYRINDYFELGAYAMYGNEFGLRASFNFNPKRALNPQDGAPGPLPLSPRPPSSGAPPAHLGPVVERITSAPAPGSDARLGDVEVDSVADGARWARARTSATECPVDAALDLDAAFGVIDGVTFEGPDGAAVCSVVLRAEGRAYVEGERLQEGGRDESWATVPAARQALADQLIRLLDAEGIGVVSLSIEARRARIEIDNRIYNAPPQAVGRTAVAMANLLPPSVEDFEITLVEGSLPATTIALRRARLEAVAERPDETRLSYLDADIFDAAPLTALPDPQYSQSYPRFSWSLNPTVPFSLFDPDDPLRADLRLRLRAEVEATRGLFLGGSIRKRIVGTLDEITRESDSELPRVRSDFAEYLREGDPGIETLKVDYVTKVAPDVYARASAGLLEEMYGGVSGEVLWKEADRDWGLGLELNWVKQRDFDMLFAFRDYEVFTGHASFYWDTGWNGMEFQLDAGRYLAQDWGGTFSLSRRFANGWEVGGFFTLTDVPFDEFGEGSFDKGLRLSIPLRWGLPFETRSQVNATLRPLTRDGGARLRGDRRLYGFVQDLDRSGLREDWGNFWK
ncbi:MAG: YjbH domain-containing protein [Pseudomonadota bacterium]